MAQRTRRTSVVRRKRSWARIQVASAGVGQDGIALDLGAGFSAEMGTLHLPVGVTIGGILLDAVFRRADAATDPATSQLQFGVIVAQEPDQAEVPRPLTEPHADWMWTQMVGFPASSAGELVSTFQVLGGPIRIRSRRKAEELGEHLWLVLQGYDIAPTFDVQVFASVLLILP